MNSNYSERESSFELMRIITQYMIVIYHIFLGFWFAGCPSQDAVYKAIVVPLHVAVLCYVFVSGYFGIKFNLRGLFRLIAYLFVYGLCLFWIKVLITHDFTLWARRTIFFVSSTSDWFIRIYLYLFLLAPLINHVIRSLSVQNRALVLIILAWISCWCGFMNFEPSLSDGKNLVHFCFLYLLGNTFHLYKEKINNIPFGYLIAAYVLINIISVWCAYRAVETHNVLFYQLFFAYNGVMLLVNAILFFMFFMRIKLQSSFINYVAKSSLAIYLLHSAILRYGFKKYILWIQDCVSSHILTIMAVAAAALATLVLCIVVDKILSPCWKISDWLAEKVNQTKVGQWVALYNAL